MNSISAIKELAVSQREHTDNVYGNTKLIVDSSNAITSALVKTSEASKNLNSILSDVSTCVEDNTVSVQKMKDHIEAFKTE